MTVLIAPLAAAQSVRLNGPLVQPGAGDVTDFAFSRSGASVVFRADQAEDGVFELFAAPRDGSGATVRLHEALAGSARDVASFAPAAGERVLFVADLAEDELFELYAAPLDGSAAPTKLSGTLVTGGDVSDVQLTPDGTRAVFLADRLVNNTAELFSVPIDGSAPPLRLDPLARSCSLFEISPDGTFTVFSTGPSFSEEFLYRVPLDASQAPAYLARSGPPGFVSYTYFVDLEISSDNQHASCTAVELFFDRGFCAEEYANLLGLDLVTRSFDVFNLTEYACYVPPTHLAGARVLFLEQGGALVSIVADGTDRKTIATNVSEFVLTPDEAQVLFVSGSPGAASLYVAPADGSSVPVALAGPGTLESPRPSPNSALVAYIQTDPATSFRALLAVATSGSAPLLLNGPPAAERGVLDFAHAPSGGALVYREDRGHDEAFELWSVDLGLVPRRLSAPTEGFRDVATYLIAPDGAWVAHLGDVRVDQTDELFGAPIDAGQPLVAYNAPLPGGPVLGDVLGFAASADGADVVYRADEDVDEFFELYVTRAHGRGVPRRVSEFTTDEGDALADFRLTPDGERVLFKYSLPSGTRLHSSALAGGPTVDLDVCSSASALVFSPDGTRVAYLQHSLALRQVPVDGSQPPTTLTDVVVGVPSAFAIRPDGLDILFLATSSAQTRLYRTRFDGSDSPAELGPLLPSFGSVVSFLVTPDSSRVVLRAGAPTSDVFELYSTPSHGFGQTVRLNGALVTNGDVTDFLLTPDSTRAVYRADQLVNNTFELHAVPLVGGPALRLTPLPAGRRVQPDFELHSGGTHAFYRCDSPDANRLALHRVALDGLSSPELLHPPLDLDRDVTSFAQSPDGQWLVYLSDERADEVFELSSVPALSGPARALVTLPAHADVEAYRIDPGSQYVFYLADAQSSDAEELYRVPIDGSAPPLRVHAPLAAASDIEPDFLPQLDGRVLYRLDRDADGALDLFHFLALDHERHAPASTPTVTRSITR